MTLEIEHKGELITFDILDEKWRWRGKAYDVPSKAKAAIDRALRVDFPSVKAIFKSYYGWILVDVTSLAEHPYAWISDKGKRSKEHLDLLFENNEKNASLLKSVADKSGKIDALQDEISELISSMDRLKLPKGGE